MVAYTAPGFQERASASATAKRRALAMLRARPVADADVLAAAKERRVAAEKANAEKRAAALAEREALAAAKRESKAEALRAVEAAAAVPVVPTEADRKAARDARYAARKANKRAR